MFLPLLQLIAVFVISITTIWLYFNRAFKYWARKGVPYIEPKFPLGSSTSLLPKGLAVGVGSKKFYDELKLKGHKFGGLYMLSEPVLVVVDPDYIKDVLIKDFQNFTDRGFYYNEKDDPVSAHLFALDGDKWKNLRRKMSPTFTSGKMKIMFDSVAECAGFMKSSLDISAENSEIVDIKEVLGCFTTDVIGSCALGIDCNSFKDPDAEFRQIGRKTFEFDVFLMLKAFVILNLPKLAHRLGLVGTRTDVSDFFLRVTKDTVEERTKITRNKRNDFMQLLIDAKSDENSESFTLKEMAAQTFVFFVAGFETSSTLMTFCLSELSKNQEIQEKLRKEIDEVLPKFGGKITYDCLKSMTYLNQVINESLRKYPPIPTLIRRCSKDYKLKDTHITIDNGTQVMISPYGLQHDPEYFPNPETFDPERFNEENTRNRQPCIFLPFGEGPRNCIGLRFGLMQTKYGIVSVIRNFKVSLSPKTKEIVLDLDAFMLTSVDEIYLNVEKIK